MIIEYSSMCLNEANYRDKIREAKSFVEKQGFLFGVQLHNSITKDLFDKLIEYKNEIPFSIHSPMFSPFFLNLAGLPWETIDTICCNCENYLLEINSNILFFHGFFMTNKPIIHNMKKYRKMIKEAIGSKYCLKDSFIMDPDFFNTDIYLQYKAKFTENLGKLRNSFAHLTVSLENDFVGIGSGLQRPQEIHELIDNLWFDLGHLWSSSILHKFDFHQETFHLLEKKNIPGVHLNHNLIRKSSPGELIRDSHAHFYMESEMNLAPIVRKIFEKKIEHITLEIVDGNIQDLEILFNWLE